MMILRNSNLQDHQILILLIVALFFPGCKKEETIPLLDFKPDQETYLKINAKNLDSEKTITCYYIQTLPAGQSKLSFEIASDTSFIQTINLNHPLYFDLYDGKVHAILFMVPDDTLIVNLDYSENSNPSDALSFQGLTSTISDYLTFIRYYHRYPPEENQSIENFNSLIDSLYELELDKVDSFCRQGILPDWFVPLEKNNIKYERDFLKLGQFGRRYSFYKQFVPRNLDFYQNIDFGEMDYYWLNDAHGFLATIIPDKYDSLIQQQSVTPEIWLECQQDNIDLVKGYLPEKALSYFVASRISVNFMPKKLLAMTAIEFEERKQEIDDFFQINSDLITDTLIYCHLHNERDKAYQAVLDKNTLHEGESAPSFYLADLNGKFRRLSDYNGKAILINFWGTYCAPCIKDIPKKNHLVKQFSGDKFVLINICMDSNYEKWKQLINTHNFKGVHLICKGNWEEKLRAEYNVYTIPHYAIIDHNGRIVKNNAVDSIANQIAEIL